MNHAVEFRNGHCAGKPSPIPVLLDQFELTEWRLSSMDGTAEGSGEATVRRTEESAKYSLSRRTKKADRRKFRSAFLLSDHRSDEF